MRTKLTLLGALLLGIVIANELLFRYLGPGRVLLAVPGLAAALVLLAMPYAVLARSNWRVLTTLVLLVGGALIGSAVALFMIGCAGGNWSVWPGYLAATLFIMLDVLLNPAWDVIPCLLVAGAAAMVAYLLGRRFGARLPKWAPRALFSAPVLFLVTVFFVRAFRINLGGPCDL